MKANFSSLSFLDIYLGYRIIRYMSFHPETKNYRYWSSREDTKLKELTTTNQYSYQQIGALLGRSGISCQSRATVLGIKNHYNITVAKKHCVNENFWSQPDKINSYWAGFCAADANISERKNGHFTFQIELQRSDTNHLRKLKEDCQFSGEIKQYDRPLQNSYTCKLRINSDKWAQDLNSNFGIFPKKTHHIMPPDLNEDLLLRWLVGYTDGDGCIYLSGDKLYISYISCNQQLIQWIKNYFDHFGTKLRNKTSKVTNTNERYFKFTIGGLKAAQFIDYVNSLGIYCLTRKWQNSNTLNIVNQFKQKYPQHFLENRVKSP